MPMIATMTRHAYIADELGERIRNLRKERGWTQTELAERVGCSRRAIVYYERDGKYPPAPILAAMAGAFRMDVETLMSPEEPETKLRRSEPDLLNDPEDRRLWRRFQALKQLTERDQAAVIRMITVLSAAKDNEG